MTKPSPSCSGREAGSRPELQMAQAAPACLLGAALRAVSWELSPAGVSSVLMTPRRQAPRQGGLRATQKTRQ